MAYVNQELKKKIAAKLKSIMPESWKYSLSVKHYSILVLTIWSAPVDLLAANQKHYHINHYHLNDIFRGELLKIFEKILAVLNTDNYDRSDSMTDYFDVGYYIDINLGRWDKPFIKIQDLRNWHKMRVGLRPTTR